MHANLPQPGGSKLIAILSTQFGPLVVCSCGCGLVAPAHLFLPLFLPDLRGNDGAMDGYTYTARAHRASYLAECGRRGRVQSEKCKVQSEKCKVEESHGLRALFGFLFSAFRFFHKGFHKGAAMPES